MFVFAARKHAVPSLWCGCGVLYRTILSHALVISVLFGPRLRTESRLHCWLLPPMRLCVGSNEFRADGGGEMVHRI